MKRESLLSVFFMAIVALALVPCMYAQTFDLQWTAGYEFERLERLPYDADRPLRAEFDYGRLAAVTHLGQVAVVIDDNITARVLVGSTSMEVHTGEGETFEYDDSLVTGLEAAYCIHDILQIKNVDLELGFRYLRTASEDDKISYVSRDEVSDDGDAEIDWRETRFFANGLYRMDSTSMKVGVEYVRSSIEQSWDFDLGRPSLTTTFEPEDNLGFVSGVVHEFSNHWSIFGELTMVHRAAFRMGAGLTF